MSPFEIHVNFLITLIEVYSATVKNNRAMGSNLIASVQNLRFYGGQLRKALDKRLAEFRCVITDTVTVQKNESVRDAVASVEVVELRCRIIELESTNVDLTKRSERKRTEAAVASLFDRLDRLVARLRQILAN